MALNPTAFNTALTDLFSDPPGPEADVATAWADAVALYTASIVPAVPGPTLVAARAVLEAGLNGLSVPDSAVAVFSAAFGVYAATLAGAMAPPGTPPPAALSVTLASVAAALYTSHASAASAWGGVIDTWFRTGLSGSTPPVAWS